MSEPIHPVAPSPGISPVERQVMAVGAAIVLHAVVLGGAAAAQAVVSETGSVPALPREPLLVTTVALLMAHCSLGAVWWARTLWPSYAKTLVGALATALVWVLLVGILETTSFAQSAAAGWAASLATQAVLAALGATVVELVRQPPAAAGQYRFTILFLLLWTAVVAVLLGAGRTLAEAFGWKLSDVLKWEYLYQLQAIGVANAMLAVSLLAALRLRREPGVRALVAVFALVFAALATPALLRICFADVGAAFADIVWLLLAEGLFVLATLGPLEAARRSNVEKQMSNE